MYGRIALLLFFFSILPVKDEISAIPTELKPLMIIECPGKNSIFQASCFKWIQFATNQLSHSGRFQNVLSISNNSFLFRTKEQVYTTTLSDQSGYGKFWIRKYFLKEYESEATILMDSSFRYAAVYTANSDSIPECDECVEIKDTLKHSGINSWYSNEKEFSFIKRKFLHGPVTIEIDLKSSYSITDIHSFNIIYALQKKIYSLKNVKIVYSPVNIYSFLYTAIRFPGNTPQQRWKAAISMWELAGERRSSYIDFENEFFYIDIYGTNISGELISSIKKTIMYYNDRIDNYSIYLDGNKIFSKLDDSKKKNLTVTNNNENNSNEKQ